MVSVVVNAEIIRLDQHSISPMNRIDSCIHRTVVEDFGAGTTAEIEDAVERLRKMRLVADRSIMVNGNRQRLGRVG